MKVKVLKCATNYVWYRDRVGDTFEVSGVPEPSSRAGGIYRLTDGSGIYAEDCEVVVQEAAVPEGRKLVEHEGVKYDVPEWAKFLTRDKKDDRVFAWAEKPNWDVERGYQDPTNNRRCRVGPYVEPKPEGHFFREIV